MDDSGPAAAILFLGLLFADIFLYGFGAAITKLNEKEIEKHAGENPDKKSRKLLELIDNPDGYNNTVQTMLTLVNMVAGAVFLGRWTSRLGKWIKDFVQWGILRQEGQLSLVFSTVIVIAAASLAALALLYIFLTVGVFLPRKLAARKAEKWAYACIAPVSVLVAVFTPFARLVGATVKGLLFLFGVRDGGNEADVTEEEIINIVQEGYEQGVIEDSEAEMISNIIAYGDKEAQDIMTHRSNVVAIDGNTRLSEAIDFMLEGTNSRYPVYEENIDHIIGILYFKDAMRYHKMRFGLHPGMNPEMNPESNPDWNGCIKDLGGLLRDAYFVPQTKNIDELFEEMQSKKFQMAIVVDEYGQTDGLVAMEDILEEIVGNILDEYDEDTEYIEEKGNDEYVMEGKTPLEELAERFDINFDGEEFETLNGFMIYRLDHIPEPGEEFDVDYQGYNFKILSVENKMVTSVLVTKLPENTGNSDAEQSALEEKSE